MTGPGLLDPGGRLRPGPLVDEDGRVRIERGRGRIAEGPLARLLVSSVVLDESGGRAEGGRRLAHSAAVFDLAVARGLASARVTGESGFEYAVELRAEPVPPRVWSAVVGSVVGRELLEAALEGRPRAVQLEHQMKVDWDEPLVPQARNVRRRCECEDWDRHGHVCKHVAALAYAFAFLVDRDVRVLLAWRGCDPAAGAATLDAEAGPDLLPEPFDGDPWATGDVPEVGPPRPLPTGAVVKRLGRSGIRVGGEDLAVALERAYAAFAEER